MRKVNSHHFLVRIAVATITLAGLFCLFHFVLEPYMLQVDVYIAQLGFWGPVLFVTLLVFLTSVMFPESIFALAAGAIFGIWWGVLWTLAGSIIASILMFVIGRHLLKNPVQQLLKKHPKLNAFDNAISNFRIIALLRLSPFNFTALCYLASVSRITFSSYVLASIAMFPGLLSTVYIGYAAKHAADLAKTFNATGELPSGDSLVHEITIYAGLVLSVTVSIVVAKVALRSVKKCSSSESQKSPNH